MRNISQLDTTIKVTARDSASTSDFSSGTVAGSAIGASATTALICALLWYFRGRRRVQDSQRDEEANGSTHSRGREVEGETTRAVIKSDKCQSRQYPSPSSSVSRTHTSRETLTQTHTATNQQDRTPHMLITSGLQVPAIRSASQFPSKPSSAAPITTGGSEELASRETHNAKPDLIRAASHSTVAKQTANADPNTPSVYHFAPPDSIQPLRQNPPNLTTDYSAASLGASGLPHWVFFQEDGDRDDGRSEQFSDETRS